MQKVLKKLILMGLATLLFAQSAGAQSKSFADPVSQRSVGFYKTKLLCEGPLKQRYQAMFSLWGAAYSDAGLISTVYDLVNQGSFKQMNLSEEFSRIINDPQHFDAVRECFGHDEAQLKVFITSLILMDLSGKLSSWALDISLLKFLRMSYIVISSTWGLPLRHTYFWFRVAMSASKNKLVRDKILNATQLASFITAMHSQGSQQVLLEQQKQLDAAESADETIQMLQKSIQDLSDAYKKEDRSNEREVIAFLMNRQISLLEQMHADYRSSAFIR